LRHRRIGFGWLCSPPDAGVDGTLAAAPQGDSVLAPGGVALAEGATTAGGPPVGAPAPPAAPAGGTTKGRVPGKDEPGVRKGSGGSRTFTLRLGGVVVSGLGNVVTGFGAPFVFVCVATVLPPLLHEHAPPDDAPQPPVPQPPALPHIPDPQPASPLSLALTVTVLGVCSTL
jgi:hypothetical protein